VNPPAPRILSISPDSGTPGQTRTVTIVTRYTTPPRALRRPASGPGISVGGAAAGATGPVIGATRQL
jgi:hypothetical protein